MRTLIIGGTSGLGLELAKKMTQKGDVYITGRTDPKVEGVTFIPFSVDHTSGWEKDLEGVLLAVGHIDSLVYAVGFFQDGRVTDVSDEDIHKMMNVGINAAIFATKRILEKQDELQEFVAITSTSQWTPRLYEPVYTAVKAALGAYANSLSLDERVKKTLVAGPAGMATNFWEGTDPVAHDTSKMLDPAWVADQIMTLIDTDATYTFAKIMREPARTEVVEIRQ